MVSPRLQVSRRQRATPYTSRVEALGVSGFSVVNHTLLPKGFRRSVSDDGGLTDVGAPSKERG